MNKQRVTLTLLTLLPLAVACGSESGSDSVGTGAGPGGSKAAAAVTGVHWNVDRLTVDGKAQQAPDSAYLKIDESGEVKGNYGCNGFGSKATFKDGGIAFAAAESTEMGCTDISMEFEQSLSRTLASGRLDAAVDDGRLTLTNDEGDTVELSEEKPAEFYGTTWKVTSLTEGDTARSLPADARDKAWLTFDEKAGTVAGSLGCNRVTAKATVRDGNITFGAPATTRKMCSGSLKETEDALLGLFKGTVDYRQDHRGITLTSEDGKGIAAVADTRR
ncbi:META domain-containing protein [Streptomyces cavernae]|uniref:META domain-containing protein n=1 Tax=Streptomyces cavernae TaxID=2259034 RepID=UPI000FEBDBE4|nr:META domain-containing protein [Streptomyces cavernae]